MSTVHFALNKQRSAVLLPKSSYSKTCVHLILANKGIFYTPVVKVLNTQLKVV